MSALTFGCGPIGTRGDAGRDESVAALNTAWQGGVRRFDTAPSYGDGAGERLLGEALRGWPRADAVVSTKVGRQAGGGFDLTQDGVRRGVADSLSRLGTDHLDLVFVHDPDEHVDLAVNEAVPVLHQLKDEGVVRAVGVATSSVVTASWLVELGAVDVVMIRHGWSLTRRGAAVLLNECAAAGVDVLAAAPFESGLLAEDDPAGDATYLGGPVPAGVLDRVRAMARVCRDHGVRLPQAALQFPLRHKAVGQVVTGMTAPDQVRENLGLLTAPVPDVLWAALDQVTR